MPGETGPKVKCAAGSPLNSTECLYIWKVGQHWPFVAVLFQGDRGFDGLPGLPGEKGHRVSKRRENFGCGEWSNWKNKHHLRLLSVSKNKILQPLICRPHSRSCAVPCPYRRFRPDWWFRRHLQSSCVLQGWHIWILHQWNSLGCLPHLWEVWLTPEPLMQCLNEVWRRIIGAVFGVFWIWTLTEKRDRTEITDGFF